MSQADDGAHSGYGDFEFERTFVVDELPELLSHEPNPVLIVQSYLLASDGYAVRVRLQAALEPDEEPPVIDDEDRVVEVAGARAQSAFLTAKGPAAGGTRYEAERELDVGIAVEMVRRAPQRIVKLRYSLWLGSDGWSIDRFFGRNAGLVLAECERGGPVVDLEIPEFCHTEVTDDHRFGNEYLAIHPFAEWGSSYAAEMRARGRTFSSDFGANLEG